MTSSVTDQFFDYIAGLSSDWPRPAPGTYRPCQGCGVRRGIHVHHKVHKAMGGRHGAARVTSEAEENKILLCETCHAASHLEHSIAHDGYSCERCPVLAQCYWGRRTLGEADPPVAPRW